MRKTSGHAITADFCPTSENVTDASAIGAFAAFLKTMFIVGMVLVSSPVRAELVFNSFVRVDGEGMFVNDDGTFGRKAGASGPIIVTALPGWTIDGHESVTYDSLEDMSEGLKLSSLIKEDHACFPPPYTSNDVHGAAIELRVTPSPEKLVAIYSLPATSTVVSATAKVSVEEPGTHVVTKEYPEWECDVCHAKQDAHTDTSTYDVMPAGFYDWPTTPAGRTLECAKWTGEMSKGLDRSIAFKVACKCEACEARFGAQAESSVDVHELYIKRNEYLGLDMTDDGKGKLVTREASAVIDPAPRNTPTYSWKKCGNCTFIGTTSEAGVTYGATSATKPSESRNDQELTVTAVVKGDDGQTASATCTTNFTVVKVDVSIGGAGEDGEESTPQNVMYSRELTKFAIANMTPVKVTCEPKSLSGTELVWLTLPDNVELFELGNDGTAKSAKFYYRYNEIAGKNFGLLGCPSSAEIAEGSAPEFKKGYALAEHYASGAKDKGAFKVVPPPPLEVSVEFKSPAKGGGWPYDPVWDDPEWAATVDGSLARKCAEDTDDASVIYTLSRDAAKVEGVIYKTSTWPDEEVDSFAGLPHEGIHMNDWKIGPTRQVDTYYAKVFVAEKETDEIRDAKSNEGSVRRACYYVSDSVSDPQPVAAYSRVSFVETVGPNVGRYAILISVAALSTTVVAPTVASWAAAHEFNVLVSEIAAGFVFEQTSDRVLDFLDVGAINIDEQWGTQRALYSWIVTRYDWVGSEYIKYWKPNPNYNPDSTGLPQIIGPNKIGKFPPEFAMSIENDHKANKNKISEQTLYESYEKGADEGNENPSSWRWEPNPYGGGYGMTCPRLASPQWNW